ncbi:hypothetical protein BY458DRAFT_558957 [Sporodiniella umbellata]|nr:hypothetical protein BY458DRAFT_558957 [Sporodiniella umbellata]
MVHKVPAEEQPVLESLLTLRAKLSAVKQNRSGYLTLESIMPLRDEAENRMKQLSALRGGQWMSEQGEFNRTDDILDEILQILSLCFLSLGRVKESSSVYSQVVTLKHIFDRLNEAGVYEEAFMLPYKAKLDTIEKILIQDKKNKIVPDFAMQVLQYKFSQCRKIYEKLMNTIRQVDPELIPLRDQMVRLRRGLGSVCCKKEFTADDLAPIEREIRALDAMRIEGHFIAPTLAGQAVLIHLLDQLYFWTHDVTSTLDPRLEAIRERLLEIKSRLERLELTHKWTLRQTDLFTYQHQLHDIVQLKLLDPLGQPYPGQTVLNFLLHKCYRIIFELLNETIPVSESLTPVYNQLTSVRQCLLAVKDTGSSCSPEELYPYQMKLSSIDTMRIDGKFYDDQGNIPEGQGLCVDILEECYTILTHLRDLP